MPPVPVQQLDHDLGLDRVRQRVPLHDRHVLRVRVVQRDGAARQRLLEGHGAVAPCLDGDLARRGFVAEQGFHDQLALLLEAREQRGVLAVCGWEMRCRVLESNARGEVLVLGRELLEGQEGGGVGASYGPGALARGLVLRLCGGEERGVVEYGILVRPCLVRKVEGHSIDRVVLEVGSDTWGVELNGYVCGLENVFRANAAKQE